MPSTMERLGRPALVLAALLAAASVSCVRSQGGLPLFVLGQGVPPDQPVTVISDVMFDTLTAVNQKENTWAGTIWFHFMWVDPRAEDAIMNATQAWVGPKGGPAGNCTKVCDSSMHQSSGCCDNVWLPHIDMPNLVGINQEAVYKYRIWLGPTQPPPGHVSDTWVHWMVRATGTWASPFDFRAWPLEHQHLLVELQVQPSQANRVALVLNNVGLLHNTPHTKGQLVPGWWVAEIHQRTFETSECYKQAQVTLSGFNISNEDNSVTFNRLPLDQWAQLTQTQQPFTLETNVSASDCQRYVSYFGTLLDPEAMTQQAPEVLVVDVMIKRTKSYYVLSTLLPLLVLTYLSFVIYAMERSDLEARMSVIVTLVLALSALQFTYDFPPSNYLNPVQQITVAGYILFGLIAVESMITSQLCRMHERRRRLANIANMVEGVPAFSGGSGPSGLPMLKTQNSDGLPTGYGNTPTDSAATSRNANTPGLRSIPEAPVHKSPSLRRGQAPGGLPYSRAANDDLHMYVSDTNRKGPGPVAEGINDQVVEGTVLSDVPPGAPSAANVAQRKAAITVDLSHQDPEGQKVAPPVLKKSTTKNNLSTFSRAISKRIGKVGSSITSTRRRIDMDEAYALLFTARLDSIYAWCLVTCYTVVVIVLLWVNSLVGDHKFMMNGKPANM